MSPVNGEDGNAGATFCHLAQVTLCHYVLIVEMGMDKWPCAPEPGVTSPRCTRRMGAFSLPYLPGLAPKAASGPEVKAPGSTEAAAGAPFEITYWMHKRLSPAAMAKLGWTRIDGSRSKVWSKVSARWRHPSGWRLDHCGHPTALWPWALYSPAGDMVCTGAAHAPNPNPDNGTAWPNLASAMMFVFTTTKGSG